MSCSETSPVTINLDPDHPLNANWNDSVTLPSDSENESTLEDEFTSDEEGLIHPDRLPLPIPPNLSPLRSEELMAQFQMAKDALFSQYQELQQEIGSAINDRRWKRHLMLDISLEDSDSDGDCIIIQITKRRKCEIRHLYE